MRLMCEEPDASVVLGDLEAFNQCRLDGFNDFDFLLRRTSMMVLGMAAM